MRIKAEEEDVAEVALAPLIDIVFLLLIFFLVATILKKDDKEIEVTFPDVENYETVKKDDTFLVIGIDADGDFFLDGEEAKRLEIFSALETLTEENPDRYVRIDTDRRSPYRSVAEILSQVRGLQVNNYGIRVADDEED